MVGEDTLEKIAQAVNSIGSGLLRNQTPLNPSPICANVGCMIRSRKLPKDPMERAAEIVRLSTEETIDERTPVQKYLAEIGRKGGLKGGKARAESMSGKKRRDIAKKAAKARWSKSK